MTTITRFTKEQLIARINKQIDINATIIERLGDDSAAVSELAVKTATMDMKILDAAAASLTAPPVYQAQYGNDWRDVERAQYDDHDAHGSPVRIVYAAPPAPVSVPDDLKKAVEFYEQVKRENTPVETGAWKDAVNWVLDEACRAAMLQGSQPVTTAYKLPDLKTLDTVKFNADCALQDPESIYAQEFFLSLDEVFGERGNYTEPVQAKAVSILIAEIFRLRGYPAAPQQEVK